ncbi:DNA-binding protein [Cryobacterium lactosi]|uniref:DNA-binding protein n=1 Tax=Cryobacterium lactosi TaxID=1259202 RepID=A0A4R9BY00_9MICO|nr:helix-turn-helix domain-containing protein [Cryobacterium lactosi]TFD93987.1 DNA-binding protein [Cryobacterium lactosi]
MSRTPNTPSLSPVNIDSGIPMLSPKEAALLLCTKPSNLSQWRYESRGPAYVKLGGIIGYRLSDIDAYIMARLVQPKG